MKLFNSLSVITLILVTLATTQHNHNDSVDNASTSGDVDSVPTDSVNSTGDSLSTSADHINSSKDSVSTPTNSISSTEQVNSTPTAPVGSSKNNNSKLEDRYLNTIGFDRGYLNTNGDATRVVPVQSDSLGPNKISNVLEASPSANIEGNRYTYPFYFPSYYPPYHFQPTRPTLSFQLTKPSQTTQPTTPSQLTKPSQKALPTPPFKLTKQTPPSQSTEPTQSSQPSKIPEVYSTALPHINPFYIPFG
jgi:hypothetical protein